ncbi:MAG TPA: ABC transporter substrate-binding protein [Candidatus Binatia bacterium]|nr:ABC transporter substrate-binding protein [Candidatus Binatia bacterium]
MTTPVGYIRWTEREAAMLSQRNSVRSADPCFENLSTNGKSKTFSIPPSFALSPSKRERRAFQRAARFLVVALLVGLSSHAAAENVKIGIPSLTVTIMPVAVAKEQGFFQKEGLNVEMVLMPAALNIKVLLAGDIQYATTVGSAVVAAVRGINTRVVMCFVDRPLLDLVASSEIGAITDLKGKLVGISSRGGLHDVTMRRILAQSGMDPSQTTFITVGGQGAMLAAVQSKRIAAGLLNPPHNFLAYREGLKNLGFAGNFVRIPSTGLVTMRETLERSPEQVRRMIRALARARIFARENKPVTVAIMKRFLRIDDEDLISKIYDYHKRAETADGRIDAALANETIRDTRLAEGITKEIDPKQVFDFSYIDLAR